MKHQEPSLSNRYDTCFARLDANHQGAFVPFVTMGDPNFDLSLHIIETLIANGADALELGLPFSDPVADGPTIQGANLRALQANMRPDDCFRLLTTLRKRHQDLPIGLLVYANLVYAHGIDNFYAKCQAAGVDSVLIADVPSKEAQPFRQAAHRHGIHHIMIIPPNANSETLSTLATLGSGYSYLLSRAGVTGTETQAGKPIGAIIDQLNQLNAPRPLLGFGITTPSDVSQALTAGASGAICGSAIVKLIEQYQHQPATLLDKLANFVHAMKAATLQS